MPREFDNGRRRARLPVKRCSLPSNRPSRREAASRSASQLASRGSDSWLLVGRRLVRERGGELLAPRSLHSRRHLAQPGVGSAAVQPHAARTRRLRSVHPAGPGGSRSNPASQKGLEADGLMPTAFGKQLKAALADAGRAVPPTLQKLGDYTGGFSGPRWTPDRPIFHHLSSTGIISRYD